jgi:hypothetical protein
VSVRASLLSLLGNGSVKCMPFFGARQRLGKHVPAATNTRNNRRIAVLIFCAVRVVSNDNLLVDLSVYPSVVAS